MTELHPKTNDVRVAALRRYDILDTPPEDDFDELVRLASVVCKTPAALIGFIDAERHWIKSSLGIEHSETDRALSFSNMAVESGEFIVIRDTRKDPRTARIAASHRPEFLFCAAAPLIAAGCQVLGALCVLDNVPRGMDSQQGDALRGLAHQVVTHLELRRNARVLADTVADLREAEKTILHLAHYDALTGLPSRLLFQDRLEHALRHAARHDETVAVMFVDLDGFKVVNDTHGHAVGDTLLQEVAKGLLHSLRRSDTVGRMGGDEFAIVCPDLRDAEDAGIVAQKVLSAIRKSGDSLNLPVTGSIGIAFYPYDGANADTLLCDADTAMYRAKRRGKNAFAFSAIIGRKGAVAQGQPAGVTEPAPPGLAAPQTGFREI